MTTGQLIRFHRKRVGLTQKELGERAGIAEPTIRRYELGKLNPKYETLEKIAGALGVWVTNLIDLSASPIAEIWGIDSSETSALQRTIINDLSELNEEGQMEAALCIHKLTENPKYKCVKPNMPKESTAETN